MRRLALLILSAAACSHHNAEPAPELGPVSELRARTDALGCKQIAPVSITGANRFSCEIDLGPCNCTLLVHVSTEERGSQSLVDQIIFQIWNCENGVGLSQVEQLIAPYVGEAQNSSLHDFLTRPRLERSQEERSKFGVFQVELFGNVRIQTSFDADNPTPNRDIYVDTVKYKTPPKLEPVGWHRAPCGDADRPQPN